MTELNTIFNLLGLNKENGLYFTQEGLWKEQIDFPNRIRRLLETKIAPDAFFCFDNKPLILFFNKPSNKEVLYKAIWNFNESPITIIVEYGSIEIFNGFKYITDEKALEKIGGIEKLTDFNYLELVTGVSLAQYESNFNYKNRVDYHLLSNIKIARKILVNNNALDIRIANAVIGKAIFVRYLIDRHVRIHYNDTSRNWTNSEFCDLLNNPTNVISFFNHIEKSEYGFQGDLFPLSESEFAELKAEDFDVIRRLLKGDNLELKSDFPVRVI